MYTGEWKREIYAKVLTVAIFGCWELQVIFNFLYNCFLWQLLFVKGTKNDLFRVVSETWALLSIVVKLCTVTDFTLMSGKFLKLIINLHN